MEASAAGLENRIFFSRETIMIMSEEFLTRVSKRTCPSRCASVAAHCKLSRMTRVSRIISVTNSTIKLGSTRSIGSAPGTSREPRTSQPLTSTMVIIGTGLKAAGRSAASPGIGSFS